MKKYIIIMCATLAALLAPLAATAANHGKILVAYFSWGGNTRTVAEYIAAQTGADLFNIEPLNPYPDEYTPCTEVALQERDTDARPAIKTAVSGWDDYDTIFIGCPVWWHEAPMIIHTFAESYDFTGKTVVPFCTYASTYRDETLAKIVEITPMAAHLDGFGARNRSTAGVTEWLESIGMLPTEGSEAEAVDLGLSVKWASCNIGASKPEEAGGLYGWADPTGEETSEDLADYPSVTPPATICGTQYDIAAANWGEAWRMPTQEEFEELAAGCTWEWTALNGVNGMKVTGKNGNSIFLPAAGSRTGQTVSGQAGQRGNYWSGTLWPGNDNFASYLYFYSDASRIQPARSNRRYIGMSVRAVSAGETGIHSVRHTADGDFAVSAAGNKLTILNLKEGTPVTLYDTTGTTLYSGTRHTLTLPGPGLYLIYANGYTKKIATK